MSAQRPEPADAQRADVGTAPTVILETVLPQIAVQLDQAGITGARITGPLASRSRLRQQWELLTELGTSQPAAAAALERVPRVCDVRVLGSGLHVAFAIDVSPSWGPSERQAIAQRLQRLLLDAGIESCLHVSPPTESRPDWAAYLLHGYGADEARHALLAIPGVSDVRDEQIRRGFLTFAVDEDQLPRGSP